MLRENVKRVDAILFTHEHKDHTGGLDDIRGYNFLSKKPLDIYLQPRVLSALKEQYGYIFQETEYSSLPKINPHQIDINAFDINGVEVTPIEVLHHRLPVLGFRINDFTYITDANHISEKEKQKIAGSKVLVLNALRERAHVSHFTLQQAIDLVEELKPDHAIFTHISHQLGKHSDVEKKLPANISLGYDGLQLEL